MCNKFSVANLPASQTLTWQSCKHFKNMGQLWGKVKRFLENQKILWNLSSFIGPSLKLVFVYLLVSGVSCCPLVSVSAASHPPASIHLTENRAARYHPDIDFPEDQEFGESRVFSVGPSSKIMLSSIFLQIVRFLVKNFMGEEWLSEDVALRRLDNLKSSLFKYYSRRNLFGATVETARDGGIGFPSLEGALLSLAFLTFSVFLIDLIQTVLNKLRMKNAATAAPAAALLGRSFADDSSNMHNISSMSLDTLTTLSSKVISAIEKPWQ